MMKMRTLNPQTLQNFHAHLLSEEKSENTTQKYLKDAEAFARYLDGQGVTKETVLRYKNHLLAQRYAPASINSKLASLNSLFSFLGWFDCKVKTVKIQRCVYCPEDKELSKGEYVRLINAARQKGNRRLTLLLQTICGTGIRVSELMHITVEAARCGRATVSLKGKTRVVFLVDELCRRLLQYAQQRKIQSGPIFITRSGAPMSRTNIWREMKALCASAGVNPNKVFPHNLRHLFARTFYKLEKDLAKLADILGHSSINTTRIYIISAGAEHRRSMESLHLII